LTWLGWLPPPPEPAPDHLLIVLTRLAGRNQTLLDRILEDISYLTRQGTIERVISHFLEDCPVERLPAFAERLEGMLGRSGNAERLRARIVASLAPVSSERRLQLARMIREGRPTVARHAVRWLHTAMRIHDWWDQDLLGDLLDARTVDAATQAALLLHQAVEHGIELSKATLDKLRAALLRTSDQHLQRAIGDVLLAEVEARPANAQRVCSVLDSLLERLVTEQVAKGTAPEAPDTGGFATRVRITIDLLLKGIYSERLDAAQVTDWVRRLLLHVDLGRVRRADTDGERVIAALTPPLRPLLDELVQRAPSMPETNQLALARGLIAREGRRSEHAFQLLKLSNCPPAVKRHLVSHLRTV
jgi:hypothetical protein